MSNQQRGKRVFWKRGYFWFLSIIAAYLIFVGIEEIIYRSFKSVWTTYTTENSLLRSNEIGALATDEQGQIWVGTKNGVCVISEDGLWSSYGESNPNLANNYISAFLIDKKGRVWIGTWEGLYVHEPNGGWRTYIERGCRGCWSSVTDLSMDRQGRVWVSTLWGLYVYDLDEEKTTYTNENSGLTDIVIRTLAIDRFNRVWIGTNEHGLNVLDQDGHWTIYPAKDINENENALASDGIQTLLIDQQDQVWVGTNRGISILDSAGKWASYSYLQWRRVPGAESNYTYALSNSVRAFALDKTGRVWMGTGGELVLIDTERNWFSYTSENSGLPGGVEALLMDKKERLWVGTSKGLTVIDLQNRLPKTVQMRPVLLGPLRFVKHIAESIFFPVFFPAFGPCYGALLLLILYATVGLGLGMKQKNTKLLVGSLLVFTISIIVAAFLWFGMLRWAIGD